MVRARMVFLLLGVASSLLPIGCPGDDESVDDGPASPSSSATEGMDTAADTTTDATSTDATSTTSSSSAAEGMDTSADTTTDATASSSGTSSESTGVSTDPCEGPEVLLYEQLPMGMSMGAPTGSGAGGFIRVADDFMVDPADQCWCVTRVVFRGYFADTELEGELEVAFYEDAPGVPLDPAIAIEFGLPTPRMNDLDYSLATPVVLPAGIHWVSTMPEIPSITGSGIWYWEASTSTFGSPWAMQSNSGPFVPTCENWAPGQMCIPSAVDDNRAFELHGVAGGNACTAR